MPSDLRKMMAMVWCRERESNPYSQRPRDFLHTTVFTAGRCRSCAGLCLHHGAMRVRCPPSSLYTFPFPGLARCCLAARAGVSPNLTGFTRVLSPPCAQFYKSLVSTNFTIPARDEGADSTRTGQASGDKNVKLATPDLMS